MTTRKRPAAPPARPVAPPADHRPMDGPDVVTGSMPRLELAQAVQMAIPVIGMLAGPELPESPAFAALTALLCNASSVVVMIDGVPAVRLSVT